MALFLGKTCSPDSSLNSNIAFEMSGAFDCHNCRSDLIVVRYRSDNSSSFTLKAGNSNDRSPVAIPNNSLSWDKISRDVAALAKWRG